MTRMHLPEQISPEAVRRTGFAATPTVHDARVPFVVVDSEGSRIRGANCHAWDRDDIFLASGGTSYSHVTCGYRRAPFVGLQET